MGKVPLQASFLLHPIFLSIVYIDHIPRPRCCNICSSSPNLQPPVFVDFLGHLPRQECQRPAIEDPLISNILSKYFPRTRASLFFLEDVFSGLFSNLRQFNDLCRLSSPPVPQFPGGTFSRHRLLVAAYLLFSLDYRPFRSDFPPFLEKPAMSKTSLDVVFPRTLLADPFALFFWVPFDLAIYPRVARIF